MRGYPSPLGALLCQAAFGADELSPCARLAMVVITRKFHVIMSHSFYGVMVSTPDSESGDPGSNPGRTYFFHLGSTSWMSFPWQVSLSLMRTGMAHFSPLAFGRHQESEILLNALEQQKIRQLSHAATSDKLCLSQGLLCLG